MATSRPSSTRAQGYDRTYNRIRKAVLARDGYRCVKCGSTKNPQCAHIVALSAGGKNTMENARCLCRRCNLNERVMPPAWMQSKRARFAARSVPTGALAGPQVEPSTASVQVEHTPLTRRWGSGPTGCLADGPDG